jgi:hypothetical protein
MLSRAVGWMAGISLAVALCGTLIQAVADTSSSIGMFALSSGLFATAAVLPLFVVIGLIKLLSHFLGVFERKEAILPYDIRSFRDLAELIAGDRGGWCEKCGYDLTGLQNPRCPECGTEFKTALRPPGAQATTQE